MNFFRRGKTRRLRQVAGFLRGVEQACRECARQGTRMLEDEALLLADMATRLEP